MRRPAAARPASSPSAVCLFLLRWGEWPAWTPLLVRTIALNPTISYLVLGDARPNVFEWPRNAAFHRTSLHEVVERARRVFGVAPPGGLSVAGGASKISDFKPMLAALFPEKLSGCDFWGYMQEDQLLGNLRAFLDADLLSSFDTISPLPAPLYNAGPFMVYRNRADVVQLYRRSSDWQRLAADPAYLVFDEWWGPLAEHMPAVIGREASAGRLRAYVADPARDSKRWMKDDFVYDFTSQPPRRYYDDTLLMTWREGVLWDGRGSDKTSALRDGDQSQVGVLHLLGSKHLPPLRTLEATDHLRRLAAHASEMLVTRHGLWLKVSAAGRMHTWYSGHFPKVHMLVRTTELQSATARRAALGKPNGQGGPKPPPRPGRRAHSLLFAARCRPAGGGGGGVAAVCLQRALR
jgi:hypothetical protein